MAQRFILISDRVRDNALAAVRMAPDGFSVSVSEPKRSSDQNALLWALLDDVSRSMPEGRRWTRETWKAAFMHSLGHQVVFCEGLDGSGPFPVGFRSSRMTTRQMSDLITCILEYGDRHDVPWTYKNYGMEVA